MILLVGLNSSYFSFSGASKRFTFFNEEPPVRYTVLDGVLPEPKSYLTYTLKNDIAWKLLLRWHSNTIPNWCHPSVEDMLHAAHTIWSILVIIVPAAMSLNLTSIENEGDACYDMAAAMPGLQTVTGENLFIITVIDGAANFYGHITFLRRLLTLNWYILHNLSRAQQWNQEEGELYGLTREALGQTR